MESPLDQAFLEALVPELASHSSVSEVVVRSVLETFTDQLAQKQHAGQRIQDIDLKAVLTYSDASELATMNHTTEDAILRVLSSFIPKLAHSRAGAQDDLESRQPSPFPPQLSLLETPTATIDNNLNQIDQIGKIAIMGSNPTEGPNPPSPVLGETDWPPATPAHAHLLRLALDDVLKSGVPYGESGVLLSYQDLCILQHGLEWLDNKTATQFTNLVNNLPAKERGNYKTLDYYLGEVSENEAKAAQTVQWSGMKKGVEGKATKQVSRSKKPAPSFNRLPSSPLHAPHLRVVDGVAQPVITTSSASAFNGYRANSVKNPIILASSSSSGDKQAHDKSNNKRYRSRSPSGAPSSKKPKAKGQKPKAAMNAYKIWSMVARPKLEQLRPESKRSKCGNILAEYWNHTMTEEERKPYIDLQAQDVERERSEQKVLDEGGDIDRKVQRDAARSMKDAAEALLHPFRLVRLEAMAETVGMGTDLLLGGANDSIAATEDAGIGMSLSKSGAPSTSAGDVLRHSTSSAFSSRPRPSLPPLRLPPSISRFTAAPANRHLPAPQSTLSGSGLRGITSTAPRSPYAPAPRLVPAPVRNPQQPRSSPKAFPALLGGGQRIPSFEECNQRMEQLNRDIEKALVNAKKVAGSEEGRG